MQSNLDCDPDNIQAMHRKGGNALLTVQNNQSLGVTANTISDVQGGTAGSGQTLSTSGSAGSLSYGADAVIVPSTSPESSYPTYKDQLNEEFDALLQI
jgi:hypothetical protein